jgi:hypothetical protein
LFLSIRNIVLAMSSTTIYCSRLVEVEVLIENHSR